MNTMAILLSAFVIAVIGLMFFIWTQRRELISTNREAAESIFGAGEIGAIEDPASTRTSRAAMQEERQSDAIVSKVDPKEIEERIDADRSSASVALLMMSFAAAWLLAGSFWINQLNKIECPGLAEWCALVDVWRYPNIAPQHCGLRMGAYGLPRMYYLDVAAFAEDHIDRLGLCNAWRVCMESLFVAWFDRHRKWI